MTLLSLKSLEDHEIQDACKGFSQPSRLADACYYLLSTKGKKLRSSVLLEAAAHGPWDNSVLVRRAAVAVELLHMASLAHDDVVDEGKIRRGQETVGAKFGDMTAVLSGGWLLGRAVELISECGEEAVSLFSDTSRHICEGQMLEVEDIHDVERTVQRYFRVIESKTASLFRLSARLGAELAGAEESDTARLERFGYQFGVAFQISDDLLDLLEEDSVGGKLPGSDMRQGIYTLPVLYALEESAELRGLLMNGSIDDQRETVVGVVRATGGVGRALGDRRRHAGAAKNAVADLAQSSRLENLVDYALPSFGNEVSQ